MQVLDVNILSDEIRIFTVTDGTLFLYCIHLDEDERHATHEVRIMVLHPSPLLKEITVNIKVTTFFPGHLNSLYAGVIRPFIQTYECNLYLFVH